ncbi:MAG: zinc ribbon domain-containing protein [Candidatus Hodarchaeota archaeon]
MENSSQKLVSIANKRFNEVLKDGFKLFIQNYGKLILPLAIFQVILIILDIFVLTDIRWYLSAIDITVSDIMEKLVGPTPLTAEDWNTLSYFILMNFVVLFFQNLIGAIIIAIAMCSVSNYVFKKYMNEEVSFIRSFRSAFNKKLILVILILGICLPISYELLIFPSIIVFGFFIFLVFTYNMDVKKNPISDARAIAKGAFLKIIGVFVINFLIIITISIIFELFIGFLLNAEIISYNYNNWVAPTTRNYGMIILYQILVNLIDILLAPLFICLLTSLFASQKAKRDLGLQYQREYYPTRKFYQDSYLYPQQETYDIVDTSLKETNIDGRFYCPYCGTLIRSGIKKFCPKCGENLSFFNK